ncbi:MAG: hypothetical protein ACI9AR_000075 [Flavobacteriaceae bacterium]|jgi:hypothetical protein
MKTKILTIKNVQYTSIILGALMFAFFASISSAYAYNDAEVNAGVSVTATVDLQDNDRENNNEDMKKREERFEKRDEYKEQKEEKMQESSAKRDEYKEKREEKSAAFSEKRSELRANISTRITARFTAAIRLMNHIGGRIEARILKLEEQGVATAEAQAHVNAGKDFLVQADIKVSELKSIFTTDIEADAVSDDFLKISLGVGLSIDIASAREVSTEAKELLKKSHASFKEAIVTLKASIASQKDASAEVKGESDVEHMLML